MRIPAIERRLTIKPAIGFRMFFIARYLLPMYNMMIAYGGGKERIEEMEKVIFGLDIQWAFHLK